MRRYPMRVLFPVAVLAATLAWLTGCGDETATLIYLKVAAYDGVRSPAALSVTLGQGGPQQLVGAPEGGVITLPASLVVRVDGWSGKLTVIVEALDRADRATGQLLGQARGEVQVLPDELASLVLTLEPADLVLKSGHAPDTSYGKGLKGARAASDLTGNLVVVWEDLTLSSGVSLYDIRMEVLDRKGQSKAKRAFGLTEEHQPAVAMQQQGQARGYFTVAWVRGKAGAGKGTLVAKSFDVNGNPDTTAGADQTQTLSLTATASSPDIARLGAGGFIVVWQEEDSTNWQVLGRILDEHGRPQASPGGQSAPFVLGTFAKSGTDDPAPAVAGDKLGSFMAVWNQAGQIKASTYAKGSGGYVLQKSGLAVAKSPTGLAAQPAVSDLEYGFAVAWTDTVSFAPDSDGRCVRVRRFSRDGTALEDDYTVNTTASKDQLHPAIARRALDGSFLVAWTSSSATSTDAAGGVRGRILVHNGLPVGDDFTLPTTTAGVQRYPALAPHLSEGYIALFTDGSSGKDALRARLLYPNYRPVDGRVGALCDGQNPCTGSLYCIAGDAGKRCHAPCKSPGGICTHGGTCTEDKTLSASYCTYATR